MPNTPNLTAAQKRHMEQELFTQRLKDWWAGHQNLVYGQAEGRNQIAQRVARSPNVVRLRAA